MGWAHLGSLGGAGATTSCTDLWQRQFESQKEWHPPGNACAVHQKQEGLCAPLPGPSGRQALVLLCGRLPSGLLLRVSARGELKPRLCWVGVWGSLALGYPGGKAEAAQRCAGQQGTGPVRLKKL